MAFLQVFDDVLLPTLNIIGIGIYQIVMTYDANVLDLNQNVFSNIINALIVISLKVL